MNIYKKVKDRLIKYKHKKQADFMWESKEIEQIEQNNKDLGEIYSKNIMWMQLGKNPSIPYYFIEENGNKYAKIPYVELDVGSYIRNGNLIINKFMEIKN